MEVRQVAQGGGNASLSPTAWPSYQGSLNLSGDAPGGGPLSNGSLWTTFVGSPPPPPSIGSTQVPHDPSPVVADGLVFMSTGEDGGVVALNESTGALVWSRPLGLPTLNAPLYADGRLFVGLGGIHNGNGSLIALNATTGTVNWTASPAPLSSIVTPPNLVDGVVVVGDSTDHLYGYSEESGHQDYVQSLPSAPVGGLSINATRDPIVLASCTNGSIVGFNAVSGIPLGWGPFSTSDPLYGGVLQTTYWWENSSHSPLVPVPIAVFGDDARGTGTSHLYAIATTTTEVAAAGSELALWTTPVADEGFGGTPALTGQIGQNLTVVAADDNGSLTLFHFAINTEGRASLLPAAVVGVSTGTPTSVALSSPIVANSIIYVGTESGVVGAVALSNHSLLWSVYDSAGIEGSPAVAEGRLFIPTLDGVLRAFGPGAPPPAGQKLLLGAAHPYWLPAMGRGPINVTATLWDPNGSMVPAPNATVTCLPSNGGVSGSPASTNAAGLAEINFTAPSVAEDTNVSFDVKVSWGSLINSTKFVIVAVPQNETHTSPLTFVPYGLLPPTLGSGGLADLVFNLTAGPGGPPLVGVTVDLNAYGGTVSNASLITNSTGQVAATFLAEKTTTIASGGVALTAGFPGYPSGAYSWTVTIAPNPQLAMTFSPPSILAVVGTAVTFDVLVSSTQAPVPYAAVTLSTPSLGGALSVAGGLTDGSGSLKVTYTAPSSIAGPGVSAFIDVTASASGFATVSGEIPVTVVPSNSTVSSGTNSSSGNPLADLSPAEGWALIGAVIVLVFLVVIELARPRRPKPNPSVWDDLEERPATSSSGSDTKPTTEPPHQDKTADEAPQADSKPEAPADQTTPG